MDDHLALVALLTLHLLLVITSSSDIRLRVNLTTSFSVVLLPHP